MRYDFGVFLVRMITCSIPAVRVIIYEVIDPTVLHVGSNAPGSSMHVTGEKEKTRRLVTMGRQQEVPPCQIPGCLVTSSSVQKVSKLNSTT